MKKILICFLGYILTVILIFSKIGFNLFNISPIAKILGIFIYILLTALMIFLVINIIKKEGKSKEPTNTKKTEIVILKENLAKFSSLSDAKIGIFKKEKKEILLSGSRMSEKMAHINNLLKNVFSPNDLTYITYTDSLEKVLKAYNNNLNAIHRRITVFDHISWTQSQGENEVCKNLLNEIDEIKERNISILNQMDNLIVELVHLDDSSSLSLDNINSLIEQTKNYQKYKDD